MDLRERNRAAQKKSRAAKKRKAGNENAQSDHDDDEDAVSMLNNSSLTASHSRAYADMNDALGRIAAVEEGKARLTEEYEERRNVNDNKRTRIAGLQALLSVGDASPTSKKKWQAMLNSIIEDM